MAGKDLEKCIVDYYSCLLKTNDKLKNLIKTMDRPSGSLKNEVEQLCLISHDKLDRVDIFSDDKFREKLIFKINIAIEDEISLISGIISQISNACQVLENKFRKLEAARAKIDLNEQEMEELIIGTVQRPRLDLLMEWAIDSSNYYNELNSRINQSLKNLNCKEEKTVINFIESFNEEKNRRADIDRILAFTQFLAKET